MLFFFTNHSLIIVSSLSEVVLHLRGLLTLHLREDFNDGETHQVRSGSAACTIYRLRAPLGRTRPGLRPPHHQGRQEELCRPRPRPRQGTPADHWPPRRVHRGPSTGGRTRAPAEHAAMSRQKFCLGSTTRCVKTPASHPASKRRSDDQQTRSYSGLPANRLLLLRLARLPALRISPA